MGIWYLKSFIESDDSIYQSVCVEVHLREVVQQWREKGGKAVIVADGHNISRRFRCDYEFVSGGEYKSIVQKIQNFIEKFQAIGLDVVFFFGGGSHTASSEFPSTETSLSRRIKTRREIKDLFSGIEEVPLREQTTRNVPVLFQKVVKEAISTVSQLQRVGADRDKAMVRYILENKCLGIITDDTDLFCYEGVPHIFSTDALDLENLTTIEYRREALLAAAGLPESAMPIFSTLMGNDVILRDLTKAYHAKKFGARAHLDEGSVRRKVSVLANLACEISERSQGDSEVAALLLALEMFESDEDRQSNRSRLLKSLLTYEIVPDSPEDPVELTDQSTFDDILAYCNQRYASFRHGRKSVLIMGRLRFNHKGVLESSGPSRVPCYGRCSCEVLGEQRRRTYSVLLFEKSNPPGATEYVEEIYTTGCRDPSSRYVVSTKPISVPHPGLYRLWNEDQGLDDTRWELLLWILSTPNCDLTINDVAVLREPAYPHHYAFIGLVLLYLHKVLKIVNQRELKVLIVLTACVPEMNATDLAERSVEYTTKEAVSVSTLFQCACWAIRWVLKVCNIKLLFRVCDVYSGLLFHYLYHLPEDKVAGLLDELPPQASTNYEVLMTTVLGQCLAQ